MVDVTSTTWIEIKKHAEDKLKTAGAQLEMQGLAQSATDFERGRIKALREILALADPRPDFFSSVQVD